MGRELGVQKAQDKLMYFRQRAAPSSVNSHATRMMTLNMRPDHARRDRNRLNAAGLNSVAVLDDLDKELPVVVCHRFCRYADDCNIYVRSRRERVMASVSRFLTQKLRLKVNEAKSAVARPEERNEYRAYSIGAPGWFFRHTLGAHSSGFE
jgi:hypothetical protein